MATNALKWYSTTDGNKKVAINLATTAAEPSENLYVNGNANITGKISANEIAASTIGSISIGTADISNADVATMTADSAAISTVGITTLNAASASISDATISSASISSASISNLTFKTKTVSIDTSNWITIDGSDSTKINIVIPKVLVVPTS